MSNISKISSLLQSLYRPNIRHVRYRKIWQREIDEDFSWAAPILEKHVAKKEGRLPEEKEISKLHMVSRIKPLRGRPWWERDVCDKYGLDKLHKRVVVKNIQSVNEDLKSVAHLVKVIPVTFPYGLPESAEDFEHCVLQDNGEFIVKKKIEPVSEDNIPVDKEPKENVWAMDIGELKTHSRKKLDNWDLNSEYFTTDYVYKHNQDGKEYRYFGDKSMDGKRKSWY